MYLGVLLVGEAFVPSLYRTGWNPFVYLPAILAVTYLPSGLAGCSVRPWGLVVVRASWPGHPRLIKKKKKIACAWVLTLFLVY